MLISDVWDLSIECTYELKKKEIGFFRYYKPKYLYKFAVHLYIVEIDHYVGKMFHTFSIICVGYDTKGK